MLQIYTVPAFEDNYFWLIQPDSRDPSVYILDPGAAAPVYHALQQYGLTLAGILITHHHHDHIDGAAELSKTFNVPIFGPQSARIPQITHIVAEGDELLLGQLNAHVIALAGHTRDHIGYFITPTEEQLTPCQPLLFSGDTLFGGGCGRLFDGSAEQLFQSLQKIAQLPEDTLIYCAHEYTLANLRFALYIEPDNLAIIARQDIEQKKRHALIPTIPLLLSIEKRTNPFLRCHLSHIRSRVEQLSLRTLLTDSETFTQLRILKDQF